MSLRPFLARKNESGTGAWSAKLRALGAALDAQKLTFRELCILEVTDGFVIHALCRSKDGNFWSSTTREFSHDDLAMNKPS
jgi:hypothetical protein